MTGLVADIDADGRTDVAATTTGRVAILLADESLRVGAPTYYDAGFSATMLATGKSSSQSDGVALRVKPSPAGPTAPPAPIADVTIYSPC